MFKHLPPPPPPPPPHCREGGRALRRSLVAPLPRAPGLAAASRSATFFTAFQNPSSLARQAPPPPPPYPPLHPPPSPPSPRVAGRGRKIELISRVPKNKKTNKPKIPSPKNTSLNQKLPIKNLIKLYKMATARTRCALRDQRGGERRHRLARRHHQADGVHGLRLDDRDRAQRSVRPSVSASFAGITLAQRPVRTCENSTIIEFDSSVGCGSPPAPRKQPVDDARGSACPASAGRAALARLPPRSPFLRSPSGASAEVSSR